MLAHSKAPTPQRVRLATDSRKAPLPSPADTLAAVLPLAIAHIMYQTSAALSPNCGYVACCPPENPLSLVAIQTCSCWLLSTYPPNFTVLNLSTQFCRFLPILAFCYQSKSCFFPIFVCVFVGFLLVFIGFLLVSVGFCWFLLVVLHLSLSFLCCRHHGNPRGAPPRSTSTNSLRHSAAANPVAPWRPSNTPRLALRGGISRMIEHDGRI